MKLKKKIGIGLCTLLAAWTLNAFYNAILHSKACKKIYDHPGIIELTTKKERLYLNVLQHRDKLIRQRLQFLEGKYFPVDSLYPLEQLENIDKLLPYEKEAMQKYQRKIEPRIKTLDKKIIDVIASTPELKKSSDNMKKYMKRIIFPWY
ncbi:hypothetical protein KY348_02115 [Candidatus Woesearchaeota archaeon]|nr:hypothetical protein [Candidatus Woesearchaeota archaeon]